MDWLSFWENKAFSDNDFQATGRGRMDVCGYLHTVGEIVRILKLKQGEEFADVGCGAGLIALSLSPWLKQVHAIDISPALIARARRNLSGITNVSLKLANIIDLPLLDVSVEKLLAYSVLQYLPDETFVERAMREIARVLKPGGRALLAANPDPMRRSNYEEIIFEQADIEEAKREIGLLDDLLWLSGPSLVEMAFKAGLTATVLPINNRIWQHFYMYDLIVEKSVEVDQ